MDMEKLVRFVFVLYCATVGAVLVLIPWSPGWERMVSHLPASFEILRQPLVRGALTGFGLVHLVWCLHDLLLFLRAEVSEASGPRSATAGLGTTRQAPASRNDSGPAPASPNEPL